MDEGQISQVINNLLINAVQAMPSGGCIAVAAKNFHLREGALFAIAAGNYVKISAMRFAQKQSGTIIAVTDPEVIDIVAKVPGTIGAAGLCGVLGASQAMNVLTLNGIPPSLKTLADGTYPLAKDIRFATTAKSAAGAAKLLEFIFSAKGRAVAAKAGVLVDAVNHYKK